MASTFFQQIRVSTTLAQEKYDGLTPADVYFERAKEVKDRREEIKRRTLVKRWRDHAL